MADRVRELAIDRLAQRRQVREEELAGAAGAPLCPEGRMGCPYTAGARVFDRVTGLEGEVIYAGRENVVVSATKRADG